MGKGIVLLDSGRIIPGFREAVCSLLEGLGGA